MSSSEKIATNTIFLYIRLFFTLSVSLFTSRLVLKTLQVQDYGIFTIVGGGVAIFSFLNLAMSSSTHRFLAFDIGRNNISQLKETFNTAVIVHIGIALIVLLLSETLGLFYINNYLNVPKARLGATNWIFQFSIFTSLISIMQSPFHALIVARERMNIYAGFSILDALLKLGGVYILFVVDYDKLELYSVIIFLIAIVQAVCYRIYCIKNFEECSFKFYKNKEVYFRLISYSGWNLFGNMAVVGKIQGTNLLLNIFFGTMVNAAYGITMQVHFAVIGFVNNFQLAMNPQIIKSYSQGNLNQTGNLIYKGVKYSFFLMLILASPVLLNTEYLLGLWLSNTPPNAPVFVKLCMIFLLIDTMSGPLMVGTQATGNVKWYQIVVGTLIFLNLPVSYIALKYNASAESVYIISIIFSVIIVAFRLFFVHKVLNLDISAFFSQVLFRIALVLMVVIISGLFMSMYISDTITGIWIKIILYLLVTIGAIFTLGIDKNERSLLFGLFSRITKRR